MRSLLIVSVYFKHVKVFIPVYFAILEDDSTTLSLSKALLNFKSEVLDNYTMIPS